MARVNLISPELKQYKANLHTHSVISDGEYTVEYLKERYKAAGYSVLAMTDHEVYYPHSELNDKDFLMLPAFELAIYGDMELPKLMRRLIHINFYSRIPGNKRMPFINRVGIESMDKRPDDSGIVYDDIGDELFAYNPESINRLVAIAKDAGFIACYNHPTWSKESAEMYTNLEGFFGMEIFNTDCEADGYDTYCPYIYEEMLRSGMHIGCVAADDLHGDTFFGGFVMISAPELTQESITDALENLNYYASRGPEIRELYYEDGRFRIVTSPVREIVISNSGRRKKSIVKAKDKLITEAEFPVSDYDLFVRFTVTDENGNTANTRGYFREEFEPSPATIPNLCTRRAEFKK